MAQQCSLLENSFSVIGKYECKIKKRQTELNFYKSEKNVETTSNDKILMFIMYSSKEQRLHLSSNLHVRLSKT